MVLGVALGILLGIAGIVQAAVGAAPWLLLGFVVPAVYLLFVVAATLAYARGAGRRRARAGFS